MITKDINDLFMLCRERLYESELLNIDPTDSPLDEMYSVTEKIEVGEKRLRLIEELGLTEK